MPLVQVEGVPALDAVGAPVIVGAWARFARLHLRANPEERARCTAQRMGARPSPAAGRLLDAFARHGAVRERDGATLGLGSSTVGSPTLLALADDLAALPAAAFDGVALAIDWYHGRWAARPEARCFVSLSNQRGDRPLAGWAAVRIEAPSVDDPMVAETVGALTEATGVLFDLAGSTLLAASLDEAERATFPQGAAIEAAFSRAGALVSAPRPAPEARLLEPGSNIFDLAVIRRASAGRVRAGSPWVHRNDAGLVALSAPRPPMRRSAADCLREHLFARTDGLREVPGLVDEWAFPAGPRMTLGVAAEPLIDKAGRGRMIALTLWVRAAGSRARLHRLSLAPWLGGGPEDLLTWMDEADLVASLERAAARLSLALPAMAAELEALDERGGPAA
jgi:hypothetical protein